jgi:hypothetical protein
MPESLLAQTFAELRPRFGAASWETQTVRGAWKLERRGLSVQSDAVLEFASAFAHAGAH